MMTFFFALAMSLGFTFGSTSIDANTLPTGDQNTMVVDHGDDVYDMMKDEGSGHDQSSGGR